MKLTDAEWQLMNALWKDHPATARQIEEHHRVKSLGATELWRELADVVAGGDQVHVAGVIVHPREHRAK